MNKNEKIKYINYLLILRSKSEIKFKKYLNETDLLIIRKLLKEKIKDLENDNTDWWQKYEDITPEDTQNEI